MHADIDISGNTMKKKILTGQLHQYNFIFGKSSVWTSICDKCLQADSWQWLAHKRRRLAPSIFEIETIRRRKQKEN